MPARLLGEAEHHRQPEPGALARLLRGEERLEDPCEHLGRHAGAGVRHGQHHVVAGRHLGVPARVVLVQHLVGNLDRQPAAAGHGVAGVQGEVQQRALDLRRVGHGGPQARRVHDADLDVLAQRPLQQVRHVGQQRGEVDRHGRERLLARERQQLLGQRGAALGRPDRPIEPRQHGAVRLQHGVGHFQIAQDDRQQVVEVVRDAAGQLAHGLKALRIA